VKKSKDENDYRALAKERGFVWLGQCAGPTISTTMWRCGLGHIFAARYNSIQQGRGCIYCAGRATKTSDDYNLLARSAELVWLGPEVTNNHTKTNWRCCAGHVWATDYDHIQRGHKCFHCSKQVPKTSKDYAALAQVRGLIWLGPEVETIFTKTWWQCSRGHKWHARYSDVRREQNCCHCAKNISKPEIQLRAAVAQAYPDALGNVRRLLPNKRFELDIYIPSLRKAVEYDGWAHAYYLDAPARDQRKNAQCAEAGIGLLRVPHKEYIQDPVATTAKVLQWLSTSSLAANAVP